MALSDDLHDHPELGHEEFHASQTMVELLRKVAMALRCQVKFQSTFDSFMDMVRVPTLEDYAAQLMGELGRTIAPVTPPMGSFDVGNVSYHCPTIQPLLDICLEPFAPHTHEFCAATITDRAYQTIADGAELLSAMALRIFNDEEFRRQVRASYEESLKAKQ